MVEVRIELDAKDTKRNATEQNEIPTLSEQHFRKEQKVNRTEWNKFGNFDAY